MNCNEFSKEVSMIYTSYFAKLKELERPNIILISICSKEPDWYKGLQYKRLAPKYEFFIKWKENQTILDNIKFYNDKDIEETVKRFSI